MHASLCVVRLNNMLGDSPQAENLRSLEYLEKNELLLPLTSECYGSPLDIAALAEADPKMRKRLSKKFKARILAELIRRRLWDEVSGIQNKKDRREGCFEIYETGEPFVWLWRLKSKFAPVSFFLAISFADRIALM